MIKEYIQKHFEKKLESVPGLVIYDPSLFYKEIVNGLENKNIQVFDASENVITARENALEYWVNVMPKKQRGQDCCVCSFQVKARCRRFNI